MANNLATIPNMLTLARISLIPIFLLCFFLPTPFNHKGGAIIFLLGAITDALDGYLARKLGQISALGEFLDPVADKLVVAVSLVFLVALYGTVWLAIPAAVIVCREIVVSALREWMSSVGKRKKVAVSTLGKVKTTLQLVAITLLLYIGPNSSLVLYVIGHLLIYAAAILTIWSMLQYLQLAWDDILQT